MLIRAALVLVLTLGATTAFARSHHYRHHHGFFSRNVGLHQSGAPASVSPRGGDRAPITGGGY